MVSPLLNYADIKLVAIFEPHNRISSQTRSNDWRASCFALRPSFSAHRKACCAELPKNALAVAAEQREPAKPGTARRTLHFLDDYKTLKRLQRGHGLGKPHLVGGILKVEVAGPQAGA